MSMSFKQRWLLIVICVFLWCFLTIVIIKSFEPRSKLVLDPDCGCRKVRNVRNVTEIPLNARSTCSQRATDRGKGQKVISYSFYGPLDSAYFNGIVENLAGIQLLYSDYVMRLYYNRINVAQKENNNNDNSTTKFQEALCELYCNQPNFDICDVTNIGTYKDNQH
jgi:hypothetical protein